MGYRQIKYRCSCGKILRAPEYARGKAARCPACRQIGFIPFDEFTIQSLNKIPDLTDQLQSSEQREDQEQSTAGQRTCRHCEMPIPEDAEICPHCDLHTGTSVMLLQDMATRMNDEDQRRSSRGSRRRKRT